MPIGLELTDEPHDLAGGREAKVDVEETPDAWIIKDAIVAVPGVFNSKLRDDRELARTALLWTGAPLIHMHPPVDRLIVHGEDLKMVGGRLEDTRYSPEARGGKGALVGTWRLYRKAVDGLQLSPVAAELNAATVQRLRDGKPVSNSILYLHESVRESGSFEGKSYNVRAVNLVPNHLAIYGAAGDHKETACPWNVCGPGARSGSEGSMAEGNAGGDPMAGECGQECKQKHAAAEERAGRAEAALQDHKGALARVADAAGVEAGSQVKAADVAAAVVKVIGEGREAKAAIGPLKVAEERRHARLVKDVVDAELPAAKEDAKTAGREAKDEDVRKQLEDDFKAWGSEQLERHLHSIQRQALRLAAEPIKGGRRDGTRHSAGREDDQELGVARADKVWPRKPTPASAKREEVTPDA